MTFQIREVDGMAHADLIRRMNGFEPRRFPVLSDSHLEDGFWWLAQDGETHVSVAFAGMVPFFEIEDGIGYLKRAYVMPAHRGQGLQLEFMRLREDKARSIGWRLLVSECANNPASARNFLTAGYEEFTPDQRWGEQGSVYFRKRIG